MGCHLFSLISVSKNWVGDTDAPRLDYPYLYLMDKDMYRLGRFASGFSSKYHLVYYFHVKKNPKVTHVLSSTLTLVKNQVIPSVLACFV